MEIRRVRLSDLNYLVNAAKLYAKANKLAFQRSYCRQTLRQIIQAEGMLILVGEKNGKPVCHCAASCAKSMYSDENIVRVMSTWGPGGIKVLRRMEEVCRELGFNKVIIDGPWLGRIGNVYERMGYSPHDTIYIKDL